MRDYALLAKAFRHCGNGGKCAECPSYQRDHYCPDIDGRINAADAIEELLAAFCLLCGICTSPPSDETFYACEIARRCLPEPPKEVE